MSLAIVLFEDWVVAAELGARGLVAPTLYPPTVGCLVACVAVIVSARR